MVHNHSRKKKTSVNSETFFNGVLAFFCVYVQSAFITYLTKTENKMYNVNAKKVLN